MICSVWVVVPAGAGGAGAGSFDGGGGDSPGRIFAQRQILGRGPVVISVCMYMCMYKRVYVDNIAAARQKTEREGGERRTNVRTSVRESFWIMKSTSLISSPNARRKRGMKMPRRSVSRAV